MYFQNASPDPATSSNVVAISGHALGARHSLLAAMVVFLAVLWAATFPAVAQTLTVLHNFNGNDGAYPVSRLTIDSQDNLYGTTGGTLPPTFGTIFALNSSNPVGNVTVLLRRTPTGICDFCVDNLLRDAQGNLYVSDAIGGDFGNGAVYKLSPAGVMPIVLYSFTGGADGKYPNDGLISDAEGNLYGTTGIGGAFGEGVVFKITPSGEETVLYSFTGGADGGEPWGRLLQDSQGNFYGATYVGGSRFGVVFMLSPSGVLTVLHTFTGGSDGGHPNGDFIADAQGNLYSTTPSIPRSVHGTVYKITQQGVLTVLHTFSGSDGFDPRSGVIMDASGNLYGTTWTGGAFGDGVVFELTANGTLTVLHSFSGSDGSMPAGGLVFDGQGNLYGTAAYGGASNNGVVFKLAP